MSRQTVKLLVGSWWLLEHRMAFANPTEGKTKNMDEALRLVQRVNSQLGLTYSGCEFAVSGHLSHEVLLPDDISPSLQHMVQYNNPRGILLRDWQAGIRRGIYPQIGRMIPAGFGYPWSDRGAFVNSDPAVRKTSHDMLVYAMELSHWIKQNGLGLGEVIYWTGPDGIRWKPLVEQGSDPVLSYGTVPQLMEWHSIVNGVGDAIRAAREKGLTGELVCIEGKPGGDPCYLDVMLDPRLENQCIREINERAGVPEGELQAVWQNEFCHSRSGGVPFVESLQAAIDAGTFAGHIHFNSGGLGQTDFRKLLAVGTRMSLFPQYVDNDFLPGQGPSEWIDDQVNSLRLAARWSQQTGRPIYLEFDAKFIRYADTAGELEKSARWCLEHFFDA